MLENTMDTNASVMQKPEDIATTRFDFVSAISAHFLFRVYMNMEYRTRFVVDKDG